MKWKASLQHMRKFSWFKQRMYRKSLLIILLAVCLPTIVIASGVKWIGTKQMESMVASSRDHQVALSAQRMDDALSYLEKISTQWAFNREFGVKLKSLETFYDYEFIRNIYTDLLLMKESNPLIEQVYLYLDRPGVVYTDNSGTIELKDADKPRFHHLLKADNSAAWLPAFSTVASAGSPEKNTLSLVYQLPADSIEPFGALVIYLKPSGVAQMLNVSSLDENGWTFVMDEAGEPLGSSAKSAVMAYTQQEVLELVEKAAAGKGSFVYKGDHANYSVSYASFKRLGKPWTFVTVDSLDKLNSPVIAASTFVYVLGLIGLLIAVVTAVIVSRKLYQPIQSLTKMFRTDAPAESEALDEIAFIADAWKRVNFESRTLEQRLEQQMPAMKEGFLLQLLQGRLQSAKPVELEERLRVFGWETEGVGYVTLGIRFHGLSQASGRFQQRDSGLISFAAVNIAQDIMRISPFPYEIINLHDLSICVLLGCPQYDPLGERGDELYRIAEEMAGVLHRFLQTSTTICISKIVLDVAAIPEAWEEVNRIVRYRDLDAPKQVLNAEDFEAQPGSGVQYPFAAEQELLQAIRDVQEEQAVQALERFSRELKEHTTKEYLFQQGMLQLYGNLQFGLLKNGYNPFEDESFSIREELASSTEIGEMIDVLRERVIVPYVQRIRQDFEKQDIRLKQAISKVVDEIQRNYAADLSLDQFADEHNLTPLTLSKAFKKATGINFINYLTDVRIHRSKELLAETDYKINDIAEAVGYQPTYFNRIFKKQEGITPSQYRELTMEKGTDTEE
ncbi:AraC family transcriptional regulator [Paenibacillus oryzisoli]|uniref:AraC family transcriptional regulator n=1 Tax=Paenibacillus oryzisoli TaxID=1850517 RepID=UPI003D2B1684